MLRAPRIPKLKKGNYMKNTFGKLGFGLAGAVAAIGLMSAGVHTAQAQLELVPNPGGTGSSANPQISANGSNWNYEYFLGIVNASTNATTLELSNDYNGATIGSSSGGLNYSGAGYTGTILNNYFQISDFNGYVSDSTNSNAWGTTSVTPPAGTTNQSTIGDWVLQLTSPTTLTMYFTGPTISVSPNNTVLVGAFTFESTIGPGTVPVDNYNSQINNGPVGTQPPVVNVNTGVEVPSLPLPAAVWPALMTLAGMAVVGGLRLRRKAV
jgi:hypothetical protein